jgi:hypothetical protein
LLSYRSGGESAISKIPHEMVIPLEAKRYIVHDIRKYGLGTETGSAIDKGEDGHSNIGK